jgi:hypothetical protein
MPRPVRKHKRKRTRRVTDHSEHAGKARGLYLQSNTAASLRADWKAALGVARHSVSNALKATDYLRDVQGGLRSEGIHMVVLRAIAAPPISQDQFKLICPEYSKGSENPDRGLAPATAAAVAKAIRSYFDPVLTPWLAQAGRPSQTQVRRLLWSVTPIIALQQLTTARRNRLAAEQEQAVITLLKNNGWKQDPSKMIDARGDLPPRHFMYKTRFATRTQPQEVDIACGLPGSYVLAMECKVTNDETNSVKRINDVLKKAAAWKEHWGSFVRTAALLQGVIAHKDVKRLLDAGVKVFWSHDLDFLEAWLKKHG